MKRLFVFNDEKIQNLEQKKQVLSFLENIKRAEKISMIVDGLTIEGECSQSFTFASIYTPETTVRCAKTDYREFIYGNCEKAECYIIHCSNDFSILGKVLNQIKTSTVPLITLLLIEEPAISPLTSTVAKCVQPKKEEAKEKEIEDNEKQLQQKVKRGKAALFFLKILLALGGALLITAAVVYVLGTFN